MGADDPLGEALASFWERRDRGEAVGLEDLVREHPDVADELRRHFGALAFLDDALAAVAHPQPPPERIGPYRIVETLGAGGMGTVYLARVEDPPHGFEAGQSVALKLVHPHLLHRAGFFRRFVQEAEVGRRVQHPNVVRTHFVDAVADADGHHHFLVMEYVEGRTLRALLEELEVVPETLCRHIAVDVARALEAIHGAGAVHRDLKPENVLITSGEQVKVMDLGVACLADEAARLSRTGAFVGSIHYAAPEQFRRDGREIDGRADLHALGVLLYELSTGVHPFHDDDYRVVLRRVLDETPRRAGELNPQLSPFFEEVIRRLLAKSPDERFASASELAAVLEEGEASPWWRDRAKAIRAETHAPLRRIRVPRETAVYGRETEIERLAALFARAKSGEGQVLLLEGEAGIGKSRLVDETVARLGLGGEKFHFLFGSYPPAGVATASGALSDAFREQFGTDDMEETLRRYLAPTPLLVPAFAAVLLGEPRPEGALALTRDSLHTVFVHALRALAAERPVILVVEDLHFAPEDGRALFASLAMAVPQHRVLLVGTMRPGLPEAWATALDRLDHTTRVAVPRLGPKELVLVLQDAFRSQRLAEELAGKIALKSDGNPFFVFEIVRGLREGQFLRRRPDGTWETTRIIHDIEVPSSIADVVQARLSDLADDDRDLLDVAACCGFEFDPSLVAEAAGVPLLPALKQLGRVERRHRLLRSTGRTCTFDHHQIQEVLYAALPGQLREQYHVAVAEALERRIEPAAGSPTAPEGAASKEPGALDGRVAVDLAEHFLRGAQGARGLRYLDAALTHLEKGYFNDTAIRLADRALAAPGLVAGPERCELLLRKAARLDVVGGRDLQRGTLDEALGLADEVGDVALRARVQRARGIVLSRLSRSEEAHAALDEVLAFARAAGDRKLDAHASGILATVFRHLGRLGDARKLAERQLTLSQQIGHRPGEAAATENLGNILADLGHLGDARRLFERQLLLVREDGDRRAEGIAMGSLGIVLYALGKLGEAREHHERSLVLSREVGDREVEGIATGNLGSVLVCLGLLAEARECVERFLGLSREVGFPRGEAIATLNLGFISSALGRPLEAREHFERSLALARTIGVRRDEGEALQFLADLSVEEGDESAAQCRLSKALALRREIGHRDGEAVTLLARGALLARQTRVDEARADLSAALGIARELSLPGCELFARVVLARLPSGDVGAALAALAAHEDSASMLQSMEARFLLWQATHDPAHLAEAKRRLDFLVEHAPPECRESMLANVRLHREIVEAWAARSR